eukprot:jgi/Mesvir1/20430/Mv25331-RA.1
MQAGLMHVDRDDGGSLATPGDSGTSAPSGEAELELQSGDYDDDVAVVAHHLHTLGVEQAESLRDSLPNLPPSGVGREDPCVGRDSTQGSSCLERPSRKGFLTLAVERLMRKPPTDALQNPVKAAMVSAFGTLGDQHGMRMLVDTQARTSIVSSLHYNPVRPSVHWECVTDFAGSTKFPVLGVIDVNVMGVLVEFCVVEGYSGPPILGQNFLVREDVWVNSTCLRREGHADLPLEDYAVMSDCQLVAVIGNIRHVNYARESDVPLVTQLLLPKRPSLASLGIGRHDVATQSPISYHDADVECQTEEGLDGWTKAIIASGERWLAYRAVEPVDEVPSGARLLRHKWTLERKLVPDTTTRVPFVRPVVLEFSGTSDLPDNAISAPGLIKDNWRMVLSFYLGQLNKGLPYESALMDFSKAFLNGDPKLAENVWAGTTRLYVRCPPLWQPIMGKKFLRLLKGVDGTVTGPRIWRLCLERLLLDVMHMYYHDLDPSLFVGSWEGQPVFVFIHVDDVDCMGPTPWLDWFCATVAQHFPVGKVIRRVLDKYVKFCGVDTMLTKDASGRYVMKLRAAGDYVQELITQLSSLTSQYIQPAECGSLRGKLNWLVSTVSPDLAVLARLPDDLMCSLSRNVMCKYISASPGLVLHGVDYERPIHLSAYCDSSLDSANISKLRGRCAAVVLLSNSATVHVPESSPSPFAWFSRLHRRVYVGSDTAEARAFCETAEELMYFRAVLRWCLKFCRVIPQVDTTIFTDSQSLIDFLADPYARTRKLDFLRAKEYSDAVSLYHVRDNDNISDALTKLYAKARPQYDKLRLVQATL